MERGPQPEENGDNVPQDTKQLIRFMAQIMQLQAQTYQTLINLLANRESSASPLPSAAPAPTMVVQLQLRAADIGFFDPGVDDKKGQGIVANSKSTMTIYKYVLAFTQRLEDVVFSRSEQAVKEVWISYLKGQALNWHSRLLTKSKRELLREASLKIICNCLVERFQEPQSTALERIKSAKYTLQKHYNGEDLIIFVHNLLRDARACYQDETTQLHTVHQALDPHIQTIIPPPTANMTIDQFLMQIKERETTITALAKEKYKLSANQYFHNASCGMARE